eukprot:1161664-Pelagomonas_calceolata.AAC.5
MVVKWDGGVNFMHVFLIAYHNVFHQSRARSLQHWILIEPGEHHRQAYNEAFHKFELVYLSITVLWKYFDGVEMKFGLTPSGSNLQNTRFLFSTAAACPAAHSPTARIVNWSEGFYAELENRSGSGSKLQYYFEAQGWDVPNKITKCVLSLNGCLVDVKARTITQKGRSTLLYASTWTCKGNNIGQAEACEARRPKLDGHF